MCQGKKKVRKLLGGKKGRVGEPEGEGREPPFVKKKGAPHG